jgi:hypothetical protein
MRIKSQRLSLTRREARVNIFAVIFAVKPPRRVGVPAGEGGRFY